MIDFKYLVNYDYETSYPCDDGCKNDYCRCSRIENIRVETILFNSILSELFKYFDVKSSLKNYRKMYAIERIAVIGGILDKMQYDFDIRMSYYGEEVFGVEFENFEYIKENVERILKIEDRIEFIFELLKLEYGYVLESLKDKKLVITDVNSDDISFGVQTHYNKLNKYILDTYSKVDFPYPKGIVLYDGNKYNVVDGYHRIAACKNNKDKEIRVFCFSDV